MHAAGRTGLDLGLPFLPTMGERPRRESPGFGARGMPLFRAAPEVLGFLTWAVGSVLRVILKPRVWHRPPSASTSRWAPGRSWITARKRAALSLDRSY